MRTRPELVGWTSKIRRAKRATTLDTGMGMETHMGTSFGIDPDYDEELGRPDPLGFR